MKIRIGCDPGLSGSLAVLGDNLECLAVYDMPIMSLGKSRHQVNAAELSKLLKPWQDQKPTIYLEQVSAMPGQGVSSMFSFGCSYGMVQGIIGALEIPMVLVRPAAWKKRAGLLGKPKDAARTLAQQLFPGQALGRKKDIGRADALLIARFGG
ncbi:MAG: hypothetical protein PHQ43_05475 [Dehalococcoidales bacterium]|nr:hypothetical protein [Dehalococcoidales bacterium]